MFRPCHTIESVTRRLVEGFDEGTILLRSEDDWDIPLDQIRVILRERIAFYGRRKRLLRIGSGFFFLASLCLGLFLASQIGWSAAILVSLFAFVVGFFSGYLSAKIGEVEAEYKTLDRVLSWSDIQTAERLAPGVASRLHWKEPLVSQYHD